MKFDERYKQIIFEWNNWRAIIFNYAYDDLQLIPNSPLRFTIELKTKWLYAPDESGSYDDSLSDGTFEFDEVIGITNVTVYNEDTDEIDDDVNDEDTFAEKYPKEYEIFVDKYFSEPNEDVFNPYDHIDEMTEYDSYDYNYHDK